MFIFKRQVIIVSVFSLLIFLTACSGSFAPKNPEVSQPPSGTSDKNIPQDEDQEDKEEEQLLNQIMKLAKQGKVLNCRFIAGKTVFDEVEEAWGKADKMDYVAEAKGTYAVYDSKGFVFGINKGMQVFEIRSIESDVKKISLSQVKKVLGDPDKVLQYPGQDILGYIAGADYKLEFVFPKAGQEQEDPLLDHLNVLYPRGTINMMADDPGRQW